jgi:dephospho-CoA kinase
MLVVGLTGNIASGKSSVAARLAELGATVIEADVLSREAVRPGTPALAAIRARWGEKVIAADGSLDRAALRRIVFSDAAARRALEAIVHPAVHRLREVHMAAARAAGARLVICDIPLLFETGLEGTVDRIVLVDAREGTRRERLMGDRGLTAAEADAMIAAQAPASTKRGRADLIIDNDGSRESLRDRTDAVFRDLDALARSLTKAPANSGAPRRDSA